jgi:small subunit ribosomal protein S27Ae
MHIFVQTITGRRCQMQVENTTQIDLISKEVEVLMGVPSSEQKLIFNGKRLASGSILSDYEINENSNIYLVVALEGGAKGKKKKKDLKKGKKSHKKRKVKMAILKYYKVDGGKIVRLRQMCKVCPPGTFLAEHENRLHCGRCNTGYVKVGGSENTGKKGGNQGATAPKEVPVAATGKGKGKK